MMQENNVSEKIIFELIGKGYSVYHSAIITSFAFEPYYFCNYYMPQMRSRGIKNIVVLIDATQYDSIMEDMETVKEFRHDFALIRIQNKTNGVFHPKVSLFLGDKQVLALVGSGNLTYSGMSYNKELWGAFCASDKGANEAVIIKDVWDYLSGIIKSSNSGVATQQLEWCRTYSGAIRAFETIELPQQREFKFLVAKAEESIFAQVRGIVKTEVETIKVIAPFYDYEGNLIRALKNVFNPKVIKCAIDESYGHVPNKIGDTKNIQFFHWHGIFCERSQYGSTIKLHAKAIQFETTKENFLLLGSSNATSAAFGLNSHSFNDEANIIICSSDKEDFFNNLGIDFCQERAKDIDSFHSEIKYNLGKTNETFLTHITLCERHIDDKLYIFFDKIISGIKVRLYLSDKHMDFDFNMDGIEINGLEKIQYVVAVLDDKEISNKSLVLDFTDLMKRNPDSKYSKIESLFHADNGDWDANIAKVLSYVSFENNDKSPSTHISKSISDSTNKSENMIDKELFENTKFRKGIDVNLYSLNMRILDQIQFFSSNKQECEDEIDEAVNKEDLVIGNAQDESQNRKTFKSYSNKNEILSYLKRLKKHYDTIAEKFDSQDKSYRLQSRGVHFVYPENSVTCNEYSYILIALMLIFHRIAYPIKGDNNNALYRRYFLELIGRFMMIYRNGYPKTNDFTYTKLEEMHRNLFVYSLLMLSNCNENKVRIVVWTLNLLDSYKEDLEKLNNYYNDYRKLATKYKELMKRHATEAIEEAWNKYLYFLNINNTNDAVEDISENSENFYFYRDKFGFIFCSNLSRENGNYSLEVIYSGIKDMEQTQTINGAKVKCKMS